MDRVALHMQVRRPSGVIDLTGLTDFSGLPFEGPFRAHPLHHLPCTMRAISLPQHVDGS